MCTGKTQVGKRLASLLGLKFADSDTLIEKLAGKSVERIFAEDGEPAFRDLERKAIALLASRGGQLIATGGGALQDKRNLAALQRSGTLFCLSASPSTILERSKKCLPRPLLQTPNPLATVKRLLALRASQYAKADYHFDTTNTTPSGAAAAIAQTLTTVPVELGERSYDIIIGRNLLARAGDIFSRLGEYSNLIVISEGRVWSHHGKTLVAGLRKPKQIILPALDDQEKVKSLRFAEQLYDELLQAGAQRDSLLLAFGGGTIGDLVGFVAATFMRGVDFVQIPTTLLAQVDSSVGGKVAVNHPRGKNLIGAFWQPRLVLADLHCLDTLPRCELSNGLAEIVKGALLADARFFRYLEDHAEDVMRLYPPALHHIIWRSCQIKADIVSKDERESGLRALLNLGHTFGHAFETTAHYHGISHGEAVSMGMATAGRLAQNLGRFSESSLKRLLALLQAYHLPILGPQLPFSTLYAAMQTDKKARKGQLRFVLPERIGKVRLVSGVPKSALRKALDSREGLRACRENS